MSIATVFRDKISKIKKVFIENEDKIILVIGIILVAVISFGAGRLSIEFQSSEPIVIEDSKISFFKETLNDNQTTKNFQPSNVLGEQTKNSETKIQTSEKKTGKFVGSVKSNKFHFPDCPYAKKIKDENEIWFDSIEDAEKQGYVAAKCCNPH